MAVGRDGTKTMSSEPSDVRDFAEAMMSLLREVDGRLPGEVSQAVFAVAGKFPG
jgi:hypothetical protein